ncbi:MAG: carbohydrate ABC transporter permease [Trueperaceae bacterium]
MSLQNPRQQWQTLSKRQRREAVEFYLWISPWLLGFIIWQGWPFLQSLYLAFTDFRLLNTPTFTGLDNIRKLIKDEQFWSSLRVTSLYVLGTVPVGNALALFVAMVLAQKLRAINLWRTIYFLPSVIGGVAVAVMWSFIFNPDSGLVNLLLSYVGIQGPNWLSSERWALPAIIIMGWWTMIGTQMVIYLAGIKGIPDVYYEAAEIDGATAWHKFWNITLPLLSPTIFFNAITGIIAAFQILDPALVLTKGGPNDATRTYIFNVWEQGFQFTNMGYASLLSWVLFVVILILTVIVMRVSRRYMYYESEVD